MTHLFSTRVYIEDVDAGGIVYYANYLKFAERARSEFLRSLAVSQSELLATHSLLFVVRHCEIDYSFPARLDDVLEIRTHVQDVTGASIVMTQEITRQETITTRKKLVSLSVRLACIHKEGRVQRLPSFLSQLLRPMC